MGPRLRELTPSLEARGSQEAGFTQPRDNLLADPRIVPKRYVAHVVARAFLAGASKLVPLKPISASERHVASK